jgi:hemolysin activation/secretion protein/opacity protein-like surface antigen
MTHFDRRSPQILILSFVCAGFSADAAIAQTAPAAVAAGAGARFNPAEIATTAEQSQRDGGVRAVGSAPQALQPPPAADTIFVTVRDVTISGSFPEMVEKEAEFLAKLKGRRVSVAQIYQAAQALQGDYVKAYPFARISIPSQDFKSGYVRLVVVDGYIEKLDLSGVPANSRELIGARVEQLVGKRHLTAEEYQRRTLLIGTLAGVNGLALTKPGASPDTNVLVIQAKENRIVASTVIDNRLPKYFGTWQASQSVALNNAFGLGEQITASVASGPDFNRYFSGTAKSQAYVGDVSVPIGVDGLMAGAGYISARSRATPLLFAFPDYQQSAGERAAQTFERAYARLAYPLILTADTTLKAQAAYEFTANRLRLGPYPLGLSPWGSPVFDVYRDRYSVFRLSGEGRQNLPWWEWGGSIQALAVYSYGLGGRTAWNAPIVGTPLSRPGTGPNFNKFAVKARLNLGLPENFQFTLIARGQTSFGQPLMITENFSLDGYEALSGFAGGTLNVDRGATVRAELSRTFQFGILGWQNFVAPYVFYAWGRGAHEWPFTSEFATLRAESFGGGFRADTQLTSSPYGETWALEFARSYSNIPFREESFRTNFSFNMRYAGNPFDPDMPAPRSGPTKGPLVVSSDAPPPLWTGFYAGLNAGYSWDPHPEATTLGIPASGPLGLVSDIFANASALGISGISRGTVGGFAGGGQIGYNYQLNSFVGGLEADLQGSNLPTKHGRSRLTDAVLPVVVPNPNPPPDFVLQASSNPAASSVQHEKSVDWFGTVRARLGYTVTPTFLAYATGGLAYGHVSSNTLIAQRWGGEAGLFFDSTGSAGRYSGMRIGWTLGAGLEWMFSPSLSLKGEFLYYDLGSASYIQNPLLTSIVPLTPVSTVLPFTRTQFNGDVIRAGLNYHFGQPAAAVASASAPSLLASGFYAGMNAGYLWSLSPTMANGAVPVITALDAVYGTSFAAASASGATGANNVSAGGAIAGGQLGYNYVSDQFLVGVESDIQGGSAKGRGGFLALRPALDLPLGNATGATVATAVENERRVDWFGTLRARAGYAFTPSLMGYATAGLAYGGVHAQTTVSQSAGTNNFIGLVSQSSTLSRYSDVRFGWTAGAGVEWMFSPVLSVKAEYLYFDLGATRYASAPLIMMAQDLSTNVVIPTSHTRFNGQIARVGMNYHFEPFAFFSQDVAR